MGCLLVRLLGDTQVKEGRTFLFVKWAGKDSQLPAAGFMSHQDVVPCDAEHWDRDCLSAFEDPASGKIFARGSQVMGPTLFHIPVVLRISLSFSLSLSL